MKLETAINNCKTEQELEEVIDKISVAKGQLEGRSITLESREYDDTVTLEFVKTTFERLRKGGEVSEHINTRLREFSQSARKIHTPTQESMDVEEMENVPLEIAEEAPPAETAEKVPPAEAHKKHTGLFGFIADVLVSTQTAAERGDPVAQYELGMDYLGRGDKKAARECFKKSAEQGYAPAQNELGRCLEKGIGGEKDEKAAREWYKKSAEQGNDNAQNNLGRCLEDGIGGEKDLKAAREWCKKSAAQGHEYAQNRLGRYLAKGIGGEKDVIAAREWFRKAAEQGNKYAQNNYGHFLERGIGGEKDVIAAREWFRKAARQGESEAQNNYGRFLERGIGGEKDTMAAREWYEASAEQGNANGQYNLGRCYEFIIGLTPHLAFVGDPIPWYKASAEQGNKEAQNSLAYCLLHGIGVEKDVNAALELYRKCHPLPPRLFEEERSIEEIRQSAREGSARGQYEYGWSLYMGRGVKKNEQAGIEWIEKAAAQGYESAISDMDILIRKKPKHKRE